jgi:hypothetical protein
VEGAARPEVVRKQTQTFVQEYAAPTAKVGQIARWHDPVCVQVVGLVPDQAAKVQARIGEVAGDVGLKLMKPGCTSNIQVVFTPAPQAVLDKVAQHAEGTLGFHYPSELKAVKTVTHPIQAWYKTATRGGGGDNAGLAFAQYKDKFGNAVFATSFPGQTLDDETVDNPANGTPTGCGDSHFSACLTSLFRNVLIVADSRAVDGKDLGAVSDYLAMLALSQPKSLDGCNALPSVIDLMAKAACPGRDAPDGFTPADATYLTALYASDAEARLSGEQGDIAGRMAGILITAKSANAK